MSKLALTYLTSPWAYRLALLAGLVGISVMAFSAITQPFAVPHNDKVNHFLAFFYLSACLDGSIRTKSFVPAKLALLILYALLIELVQNFLPYRDFSLLDVAADGLGIFSYWVLRNYFRRLLMN